MTPTTFHEIATKPNAGDKVKLTGGLISYEVLDTQMVQVINGGPGGSSPIVMTVVVRRTELWKPDADGKGGGTFAERTWQGSLHLDVWADILARAATVERAHVAANGPKLAG